MDIMTYAASVVYTNKAIADSGGGSGGTTNYNALTNKPSINGVELAGNQTAQDLKINYVVDLGEVTSGQQITITEEQMQSFLSDNPPDVKMTLDGREVYIKRFANTETDAYFSGSAISSSIIYSVTMSASRNTVIVNAQISQQLPEASLTDAGKVPAVNKTGNGYELIQISDLGNTKYKLLSNIQLDQPADVIKADGFDVHELLVFFQLKTTADLTPVFVLNGKWTSGGVYVNLESKIAAADYFQKYMLQAFAASGNAYAMRIGIIPQHNTLAQQIGADEYDSITSAVLNKIGDGQYAVGCKMVVYGR